MSNSENYICPRCGREMSWTGLVCQDPSRNAGCYVLYLYKCFAPDCNYEKRFNTLDKDGLDALHRMRMTPPWNA